MLISLQTLKLLNYFSIRVQLLISELLVKKPCRLIKQVPNTRLCRLQGFFVIIRASVYCKHAATGDCWFSLCGGA